MCSIGGAVFNHPISAIEAQKIVSLLLFFGRERGDQSAGFWLDTLKEPVKRALEVAEFLETVEYKSVWAKQAQVQALLTHTRLPTSGGKDSKHAQPFQCGRTVTVHNGTILNPEQLEKSFQFYRKTNVDSEIFARYIARYGVRNLPKFLRAMSGCAAVGAYHNGSMYVFRDNNPLHICKIKGDGIIFGSTKKMVEFAVASLYGYYPADSDFVEIPENEVLRLMPDGTVEKVATFVSMVTYQSHWEREWGGYGYDPKFDADAPPFSTKGRIIRTGSLVGPTPTVPVEPYSIWIKDTKRGRKNDDVIVIESPIGAVVESREGSGVE